MNGLIAWFTRNSVAANLLLVAIFLLGLQGLRNTPIEVFPELDPAVVTITVPYRGASPEDVEKSVVLLIEEEIQDLEGIKKILSDASEGSANIRVEVAKGYDRRDILDDIKNRVDAISNLPEETENPVISVLQNRQSVITVIVAGDLPERELRRLGEEVRDDLLNLRGVTQVALQAVRPYEIAIEVSQDDLRSLGITLEQVAAAVREGSLDLPAGALKTPGGEVPVRTQAQAYTGEEFADIVLLRNPDGTRITLGEVAEVRDGFEETPVRARYNGMPALTIDVSRVGDQNAIELAKRVREYIEEGEARMPPGVEITYWSDSSRIVESRLSTLVDSAKWGGILVFLILALFLRLSLAFWVVLGIPFTFAGALWLMPYMGVTLNIISLFSFIMVLGIVVDDAIVVGENIYAHMRRGERPLDAAIKGSQEVAMPVVFGILTTVMAFVPLLLMPGDRGKIFFQIPAIVIPVLLFSLVESKLILPAHLKHLKTKSGATPSPTARGMEWLAAKVYKPVLDRALRARYTTLAIFIGLMVLTVGWFMGGRIKFIFFPKIDSERATATLVMPLGTSVEVTAEYVKRIEEAALSVRNDPAFFDEGAAEPLVRSVLSVVGGSSFGSSRGGRATGQSHMGEVSLYTISPEDRTSSVTMQELVDAWRERIGPIPGAERFFIRYEIGHGGDPIDIQLYGPDYETLLPASEKLQEKLSTYSGVFSIRDSFVPGKTEVKLELTREGEVLDVQEQDIARQTRAAFYGIEAQRIQRGREDVRVMVRYPRAERESIEDLEEMRVRLPDGTEIPLEAVADLSIGAGYSTINRVDRNRVVNVRADLNTQVANADEIHADLERNFLPGLMDRYPGLRYTYAGEKEEQQETFASLQVGSIIVLFGIYAMLAIPFRSYIQPLIVMSVIPFGLMGALFGHVIMGKDLSIMSIFGMLALIGVVVNDSLVLVDYINKRRKEGIGLLEAVGQAGLRRFRAVLLTSLTTVAGLLPLLSETSTQAQFLIPMAISLAFGIIFATFITLLLVPINYLVLEDVFKFARWWWGGSFKTPSERKAAEGTERKLEPNPSGGTVET